MEWRAQMESELERAAQARSRGNEGQARVCARRAAGIAAREFLSRHRVPVTSPSTLEVLQQLREDQRLPADLAPLIDDLTRRVDQQFALPPGVDLLAEARRFCESLLPG